MAYIRVEPAATAKKLKQRRHIRASGVSSMPRRLLSLPMLVFTGSSAAARHRAAHGADPVTDDDVRV
jgi:hypothetical protein